FAHYLNQVSAPLALPNAHAPAQAGLVVADARLALPGDRARERLRLGVAHVAHRGARGQLLYHLALEALPLDGEERRQRLELQTVAAQHLSRLRREEREMLGRYRDRKSTRLNSSHSQISYAVFCLK